MEQIEGSLEHIVFSNEESGFTVAKIHEIGKAELTIIVGQLPGVQKGEILTCKGTWKQDKRFGQQFAVVQFEVSTPTTSQGIEQYLASGMIAGIGPTYAKRIVQAFGTETFNVFDNAPTKLLNVNGIGQKKYDRILKAWRTQKDIRSVFFFLQRYGISPNYAQRIFKVYGSESIEKVRQNPYRLASDVVGIGFIKANSIAMELGIATDSAMRIDAGILYHLQEQANQGHSCYPLKKLLHIAQQMLGVVLETIEQRIQQLEQAQKITIRPLTKDTDNGPFVWLPLQYQYEQKICTELERLQLFSSEVKIESPSLAIEKVSTALNITLAKQQTTALEAAIKHKVQIITGGPGTGKSTITKILLQVLKAPEQKILLSAPTGRAAKRLSAVTGNLAHTIHSLLGVDFTLSGFKHHSKNPLECTHLIVDESSMIDNALMVALLEALPDRAHLILIGDPDQLPSVGAGNVLSALIASAKIPVVQLTEIYRQAAGSKIIQNAHLVNSGALPDLKVNKDSDFFFLEQTKASLLPEVLARLMLDRLPKAYGFDRFKDIQLLCPTNRGTIGNHSLNKLLQLKIHGAQKVANDGVGHRQFVQGDKVIQTKNNYEKNIFNGDIGFIKSIDKIDKEVSIRFDTGDIIYEFSELLELELAYSVSVHKFQGSESPCVILVMDASYRTLLFRNLLYTALTRGKQLVLLVGSRQAIQIAVDNQVARKRFTGLEVFLNKKGLQFPPVQITPQLTSPEYPNWVKEHFNEIIFEAN